MRSVQLPRLMYNGHMNKIVMTYQQSDGCTYSCDVVLPIFAESPEAAYVEFEELATTALGHRYGGGEFTFHGHEMNTETFYIRNKFYPPNFLTIEQWFNKAGA